MLGSRRVKGGSLGKHTLKRSVGMSSLSEKDSREWSRSVAIVRPDQ